MTYEPKPSDQVEATEPLLSGPDYNEPFQQQDEEGGPSYHFTRLRRTNPHDIIKWTRTRLFWILLPSFVSRYFGHSDVKAPKVNDTSYLNGLRGVAALVVVLQHTSELYYPEVHFCKPLDGGHYYQLPYLRLVVLGSFSVALFFVISGFALSYGSLKKIHAGNPDAAILAMPSNIFRRPIRLFLPILPVYIVSMIAVQAQFMYSFGASTPIPAHPTMWVEAVLGINNWLVLDTAPYKATPYFVQLWTLHDEHMGSLLVFLCCLAFARTRTLVRMSLVSACAAWQFHVEHWANFLFLAGMLIADLRHALDARPDLTKTYGRARAVYCFCILVMALFFGSWPYMGDPNQCVGFRHFANWGATASPAMPQPRLMYTLAASATVFALEGLPMGRALFNTAPILYLGEISFSFYLLHWFIGNTWAKRTALWMVGLGYTPFSSAMAAISITVVTGIWCSDLLWRFGDVKSVQFARWLSKRLGISS